MAPPVELKRREVISIFLFLNKNFYSKNDGAANCGARFAPHPDPYRGPRHFFCVSLTFYAFHPDPAEGRAAFFAFP